MSLISRIKSKIERTVIDNLFFLNLEKILISNKKINTIVMYHGVDSNENTQFNSRCIGVENFKKQILFLKKHTNIISLQNFFEEKFDPKKSYYVEQINKDDSSLYLTSTQQLPLQTDKTGNLNPLTNPIDASKYFNAQAILNSDRVVLNAKRDEIMLFAKTNIELNTKNIINLNADERVHLSSNTIFLGTVNNQLPTEPLVLGDKLNTVLENLLDSLYSFGASLSTVVGSPEGAPAMDINAAAESLLNDIDRINNNLEGILSQQNFTA